MLPAARRLDFGLLTDTLRHRFLDPWLSVPKGLVAFEREQSPARHAFHPQSSGVPGSVIYVRADAGDSEAIGPAL
jgi:hypothetical protein